MATLRGRSVRGSTILARFPFGQTHSRNATAAQVPISVPIHCSAIIDSTAQIDSTAIIGPYCVVNGPVRIGPRTTVGPFVQILGHTEIGSDCQIHAAAIVGDVPQDRSFTGNISYCRIGDGTILREHVTVHRGSAPESATNVGQRCLVMAGAHIGHNCQIHDEAIIVNGALLGGYVQVGRKAMLSGNVGVHQFVRIGELAMIGGLSMVTQDVPPYFMLDNRGLCVGINRVGLRRSGLNTEECEEAKTAYRILCRMPGSLSQAISKLEAIVRTSTGRNILEFVSAPSKRGLHLLSPKNSRWQCDVEVDPARQSGEA